MHTIVTNCEWWWMRGRHKSSSKQLSWNSLNAIADLCSFQPFKTFLHPLYCLNKSVLQMSRVGLCPGLADILWTKRYVLILLPIYFTIANIEFIISSYLTSLTAQRDFLTRPTLYLPFSPFILSFILFPSYFSIILCISKSKHIHKKAQGCGVHIYDTIHFTIYLLSTIWGWKSLPVQIITLNLYRNRLTKHRYSMPHDQISKVDTSKYGRDNNMFLLQMLKKLQQRILEILTQE